MPITPKPFGSFYLNQSSTKCCRGQGAKDRGSRRGRGSNANQKYSCTDNHGYLGSCLPNADVARVENHRGGLLNHQNPEKGPPMGFLKFTSLIPETNSFLPYIQGKKIDHIQEMSQKGAIEPVHNINTPGFY